MNTHTHTQARAHTCSQTQLHSAHVWNEQGSYLLETHHWARGEVERRHAAGRGGRREKEGAGRAKIEREGGVTWCACWWVWTWEFAADWRSWAEPLSSFCSSNAPLHWPQRVSRLASAEARTHNVTIIVNCGLIVEFLKGKNQERDMLRSNTWWSAAVI